MNETDMDINSEYTNSYFDIKLKPNEENNENIKVISTSEIFGVLFLSILMIGIVCFSFWKVKIYFRYFKHCQ